MSGHGGLDLAKFYSLMQPMSELQVHDMIGSMEKMKEDSLPPVLIYRPLIDQVPANFFRFMVKNPHIPDHYLSYDFLLLERRDLAVPYVLMPFSGLIDGGAEITLPPSFRLGDLSFMDPLIMFALAVQVLKLMAGDAASLFSISDSIKAHLSIQGSWPERPSDEGVQLAQSMTWFPAAFLPVKPQVPSCQRAFVMYQEGQPVKTSYGPASVAVPRPVGGSPGDDLESSGVDSEFEL